MIVSTEPALIDARAVARILGCSDRHVRNLDERGELPRSRKLGRLRRWSAAEIDCWIEAGQPLRAEWEEFQRQRNAATVEDHPEAIVEVERRQSARPPP